MLTSITAARMNLITTFVLILCIAAGHGKSTNVSCTTPNNERASCVSLFSCPPLVKSVSSTDPSTIDFVKKSLCGDDSRSDIKVCCGSSGNFIKPNRSPSLNPQSQKPTPSTTVTKESHRDYVIRTLLPNRIYCGLQHTDDRFYNQTETALDEFPWLVLVKWYNVEDGGDFDERCNGVLISKQYVLTDYLCGFHATKVKLGQHVTGQTVTCVEDPNYPECTEPTLELNVTEKFRWAVPTRSGSYNFVLMRLAERIEYTDYIRPICLPIDDTIRSLTPQSLTFSGWGALGPNGVSKKRLIYDVVGVDDCYKSQDFLEGNVKSAQVDLVCMLPRKSNNATACNGDHGGPIMFSHSHQWFAKGILITVKENMGSSFCSNEQPVNGIAITPTIVDWILSNMHD